jgi:hypothetical protein
MKRTTTNLMLAAILLSSSVYAQNTKMGSGLKPQLNAGQHTIVTPPVAGKSTATASRPIAASNYNFDNGVNYAFEDTTFLNYTGERGADSLLNVIKYDQLIRQEIVASVLTNDSKTNQTFDGNDNILTSLSQNWNTGLSTWVNSYQNTSTYDVNNNMLTNIYQIWNTGTSMWVNSNKTTYTYDVNNNMLTSVYQSWDAGTMSWDNSSKNLYSYDVNNNVTTVISQSWDAGTMTWVNSSRITQTYDVNGDRVSALIQNWNTIMSSWDNSLQYITTYDGNHHMLVDIRQDWVLGVWQNDEKSTYTYTGNDLTSVTGQSWNNVGSTWDNSYKYLFAYDGDHNRISQIRQSWNMGMSTWDNEERTQRTYNNYHQYTSIWTEQWNSGIWEVTTSDEKQYVYYEEYTVASVANTTAVNNFSVYPVPAQNVVTVEKTWAQPQDFTVSIIDLQGRTVRNYSEKATTNYSRNIDVNQLPAGNYVLKLSTKNGKVSYQQFTVIH